MFIHKQIVTIPAPPEKVFNYLTTPAHFPMWLKDIWIAGRTFGKMGLGCRMVQTIRIVKPRKFTMHVTGFVPNRYLKIEALKGFVALPCFSFSLKPLRNGQTELTVYVALKGKIEVNGVIHPKTFFPFYPLGVAGYWKIYLQLLEKAITKEPGKAKTKRMAA